MRSRFFWLALLPLACSPSPRAEVSGTVSLNGKPIEEGSIQFIPVDGTTGPSTGAAISRGRYHVPAAQGAMVGRNRVELRAFEMSSKKMQDPTAPPGTLAFVRVPAFPSEYNDRSTLVREVRSGSNALDFDVWTKDKGKSAP